MHLRALSMIAILSGTTAFAAPVTLSPADPQPNAGDLSPGLAVSYAYPSDVRTLDDASGALRKGRKGPPLKGLSYEDNSEGDLTLTSRSAQKVAAAISAGARFLALSIFEKLSTLEMLLWKFKIKSAAFLQTTFYPNFSIE